MKYIFYIVLFFSFSGFSQQKLIKTVDDTVDEISILSFELDYVRIVNSETDQIEIELQDVNAKDYQIIVNEATSLFKISFKKDVLEGETKVFRKFITKRISKVNVVLKIPRNKKITIFGKHVDVYSKSYKGDLKIYIDKGDIQLNEIKQNAEIRMFDGNVSAKVYDTNIDVISNNGTILINGNNYTKNYKSETLNSNKIVKIFSINANIKLLNSLSD